MQIWLLLGSPVKFPRKFRCLLLARPFLLNRQKPVDPSPQPIDAPVFHVGEPAHCGQLAAAHPVIVPGVDRDIEPHLTNPNGKYITL